MIAVTAQQDFDFRGVSMTKGETREIHGMKAVILKAKGLIAYGRPEAPIEAAKKPRVRKPRTNYKRRDMVASVQE